MKLYESMHRIYEDEAEDRQKYEDARAKAQKELDKCLNYMKQTDEIWGTMLDLKLYDVSHWLYDNQDKFEDESDAAYAFYVFSEVSFEDFEDWLKEEFNSDFYDDGLFNHIGDTSKFYLTQVEDDDDRNGHGHDYVEALENVLSSSYGSGWSELLPEIDDDGQIVDNYDHLTDMMSGISDDTIYSEFGGLIDGDVYSCITDVIEDARKVYDYIKYFKDHQVEYFIDFCEANAYFTVNESVNKKRITEDTNSDTYKYINGLIGTLYEGMYDDMIDEKSEWIDLGDKFLQRANEEADANENDGFELATLRGICKVRGDMFTSDREVCALGCALELVYQYN